MDPNRYRKLDGIFIALACVLSACGSYGVITGIAGALNIVAHPWDPSSALAGITVLSSLGLIGVGVKRIGLVSLFSALSVAAFCVWGIRLANADPLGQFGPIAACLCLLPLLNAVLLRVLLYAFAPNYGHADELGSTSIGQALASNPALGGWIGPAGTRAPTPPIASPRSSSEGKDGMSSEEDAAIGNQA